MATKFKYRPDTIFTKVDRTWRKLKRLKITGVRGLCCGSCSACEGGNRMDADESLVGYAYYHVQDRDGAEEHGLYIGFGARDASDEKAVVIGQQLYMLFVQDGFKVEWDGTAGKRLVVKVA